MKPLRIFIEEIGSNELPRLLIKLHAVAAEYRHELVTDPSTADMILLAGSWTMEDMIGALRLNPLLQRYPRKCVAYSDDDAYLPLVPGVYCSPISGFSTRTGRVLSYSYIVRHIQKGNPFVRAADATTQKDLLFSFQGASTAVVRKRLFLMRFNRSDVLIEDTSSHRNWVLDDTARAKQQSYVDTILRSHFVLCPRGGGTGSVRLFEVMRMGVAPVLIADGYVLPKGPDWDSFLIRVPEWCLGRIPGILERHRSESVERGRLARAAWEQWFDTDKEFNQIVALCEEARESSFRFEWAYRMLWVPMIGGHVVSRWLRRRTRSLILHFLAATGLRPPFSVRSDDTAPFDPRSAKDDIDVRLSAGEGDG